MKRTLLLFFVSWVMAATAGADTLNSAKARNDHTCYVKGSISPDDFCRIEGEFGKGNLEFINLAANGIPSNLFGDINAGITAIDPKEKCYQFFEIHRGLFGLVDPRVELQDYRIISYEGYVSTIKFQQVHNGVKIDFGQYFLHFNRDGTLNGANGHLFPEAREINTTPAISVERALERAGADYADYTGLKFDFSGLEEFDVKVPEPELIIHARKGKFFLCWRVNPGIEFKYFIDAHTGEIVDKAPAMIID
jgi:Zn-dependent metalloprotease